MFFVVLFGFFGFVGFFLIFRDLGPFLVCFLFLHKLPVFG